MIHIECDMFRYVLDDLRTDPETANGHWRPQHMSCPFCLLGFNVYARMEELDQDSLYFFSKANLTTRVNYKQKLNSAHAATSTEQKFWREVEKDLILLLEEPWAYGNDFQMFEYSVRDYMKTLELFIP